MIALAFILQGLNDARLGNLGEKAYNIVGITQLFTLGEELSMGPTKMQEYSD